MRHIVRVQKFTSYDSTIESEHILPLLRRQEGQSLTFSFSFSFHFKILNIQVSI